MFVREFDFFQSSRILGKSSLNVMHAHIVIDKIWCLCMRDLVIRPPQACNDIILIKYIYLMSDALVLIASHVNRKVKVKCIVNCDKFGYCKLCNLVS